MRSRICSFHRRPDFVLWVANPSNQRSTYHPDFLERDVILQRDHVICEWDELEVVRRDADLSQHAFFLQNPVDQSRNARDKYQGVCVFLGFLRVSLDLVCPQRLSTRMRISVRNGELASDDLDITNERTTEIHHIGCGRS